MSGEYIFHSGNPDDRRNGKGEQMEKPGNGSGGYTFFWALFNIFIEHFLCAKSSLSTHSMSKDLFNPYDKPMRWVLFSSSSF